MLKERLIACALAVTSLFLPLAATPSLPALTEPGDADAWGYVHDGEKGVADVLVTDGFNFVRTDATGAWRMKTYAGAEFVYVIIPSGYEMGTMTDGIVRYYERIERGDSPFRADFTLNPIGDDTVFSFMVHADPQPNPLIITECFSLLSDAYKEVDSEGRRICAEEGFMPFMLTLGDVTHEIGYVEYKDVLKRIGFSVPLFSVPGNHDKELDYYGEAASRRYRATFGPLYYSFNRGKAHFIMLDNVGSTGEGGYTRELTDALLDWVEKDLSYVDRSTPVVVCGHIPFTYKASALKAYKRLLAMLEGYDTMLMSGHLHRSFGLGKYSDTIEERNHSSLSGHKWRGPVSRDGTPNGYYIYHFDGTALSWKFKPLRKDADKSLFRMYEPEWTDYMELEPSENTVIIVDAWDYDEHWKLTWSLNGVEQGEVPRFEAAFDPLAAYNYNPLEDENLRAVTSGHIFHCDVPPSGGVVEVTAVDRFGRTMSRSQQLAAGIGEVAAEPGAIGVRAVEIYDMQGRMVHVADVYPGRDALSLAGGCYIMRVLHFDGTASVEKIVITK